MAQEVFHAWLLSSRQYRLWIRCSHKETIYRASPTPAGVGL